MTHRDEVKERLKWRQNESWYGFSTDKGFFLKRAAPPEAKDSFKKWVAHQNELGEEGYNYSLEMA